MAQVEAATVQITGVRVERTDSGLEITLETAEGKPLQVDATQFRSEGNSLIADIPNAVLALPTAQEFTANNPTGDIANVRVTQVNTSSIRVSVMGNNALPTSEVTLKTGEFAYSLNPEAEEPDEEIVVTGEGQRGYQVPNSSTATKTDTPLRDIPQSIQVVPQQVIRDQQVTRLEDALRNVPGVTTRSPTSSYFTQLTIRGFNTDGFSTSNVLRNGLRDFTGFNSPDVSNVERIEVLKGPASVLFGSGNPGGTINVITKQPLRTPFYTVDATIGSYDFYRGAIDLTGPLNTSRSLLYRLNLSYRDVGDFVDFIENKTLFIAPVLTWAISDRTSLTLEGEYISLENSGTANLPAVGTAIRNPNGRIPRNRNNGEPSDFADQDIGRVGYTLTHQFSENWFIRNAFRANFFSLIQGDVGNVNLRADNRTLNRSFLDFDSKTNFYSLTTDVVGNFSTGSIKHQLLLGFDLFRRDSLRLQFATRTANPLDLFNPVYGQLTLGAVTGRGNSAGLLDQMGLYLQDQIELAANLKLLLGLRFDTLNKRTEIF